MDGSTDNGNLVDQTIVEPGDMPVGIRFHAALLIEPCQYHRWNFGSAMRLSQQ